MYWIFFIIFIFAVLIPDIIRGPISYLTEERAEEVAIFLMGAIAFLVFIRNELQLTFHKKEKEKDEKKINQTVKDLVESYSYIGEVNRKMDILMSIALGLSDRSLLSKKREGEIYDSIASAASFLLKAENTCLRFFNMETKKLEREARQNEKKCHLKNKDLLQVDQETSAKKIKNCLVIASPQEINKTRCYIIVSGYDKNEENNPKNLEIIKLFASQAIFLYSYISLDKKSEVVGNN